MQSVRPVRRVAELGSLGHIERMKPFLPHLFWLSGIACFVVGIFVGGGVPASEHWSPREIELLDRSLVLNDTGAILIVVGVIWLLVRWLRRCFSHKNVSDDHVA